jgi:hypothetical protein
MNDGLIFWLMWLIVVLLQVEVLFLDRRQDRDFDYLKERFLELYKEQEAGK